MNNHRGGTTGEYLSGGRERGSRLVVCDRLLVFKARLHQIIVLSCPETTILEG
jgi:hypothetical protein